VKSPGQNAPGLRSGSIYLVTRQIDLEIPEEVGFTDVNFRASKYDVEGSIEIDPFLEA
jgi:hypothetical protein